MLFSEIPEYIDQMKLYSENKMKESVECINRIFQNYDLSEDQISFLLRRRGDINLELGLVEESMDDHQLAELADPDSYLSKYMFCKFLIEKINCLDRAKIKCENHIKELRKKPFSSSEEDYSSEEYIRMFSDLYEREK